MKQGDWDAACKVIADGIKSQNADEGLIQAIELMGDKLEKHFPRQDDDVNELPDQVHFIVN